MDIKCTFINTKNLPLLNQIYNLLKPLEEEYPNFHTWYYNKIISNITQTRGILLIKDDTKIIAIAILKDTENEKKICTFRVLYDEYKRKGIGTILMDKCLQILNTKEPLITVSEERCAEFRKLFDKYNFKQTQIYKDYYRKGKSEISYNDYLIKDS